MRVTKVSAKLTFSSVLIVLITSAVVIFRSFASPELAGEQLVTLDNVYRVKGSEPQVLQYFANDDPEHDRPRIVVRVDASGHNGYGTGHGPRGAASYNTYDFGRLYFDDGTTLDVSKMSLEGWSGQPPAVVKGTPITRSK